MQVVDRIPGETYQQAVAIPKLGRVVAGVIQSRKGSLLVVVTIPNHGREG